VCGWRQRCQPPGGEFTGPNPTDRGKVGNKRHLVTDRQGLPLMLCVTGAHRHDSVVFEELVDALPAVAGQPGRPRRWPDKLHADKGYDFKHCWAHLRARSIKVHIASKGAQVPGFTTLKWVNVILGNLKTAFAASYAARRLKSSRISNIRSTLADGNKASGPWGLMSR
jgi:hypothetical protein